VQYGRNKNEEANKVRAIFPGRGFVVSKPAKTSGRRTSWTWRVFQRARHPHDISMEVSMRQMGQLSHRAHQWGGKHK